MNQSEVTKLVKEEFLQTKAKLKSLFIEQWNDPELPGMEKNSSKRLADWLEQNEFEVFRSAYDIPTAFIADRYYKNESPTIGILAEYDALPGLDNAAIIKKKSTGKKAGHGCGHNHIGPVNAGAAIIASNVCRRLNIPSKISVVGCPAEEILWGKIALLNKGAFSKLDCILTSHGDYQNGAMSRPCQSVVAGELIFEGQAGHGGQLHQTNALNAVEKAVALIEETLAKKFPNTLFRHIIRQAGLIPTVTPSESRLWYATRGFDFLETKLAYDEIIKAAKSISKNLGIKIHHQLISETRGYLPNDTLGVELYKSLKTVGPPKWSSEDLSFMKKLVSEVNPAAKMTLHRDIAFFNKDEDYFGQDDGEVSWRIPLGRLNWAYPEEIPIHHWAWTALSGNTASEAGPLMACEALALSIVNLLINPSLITKSKKELKERVGGLKLEKPRIGAFDTLTKTPEEFWDATWREPNTKIENI